MTKARKLPFVISDFYCLQCETKTSLPRKINRLKEKYHLKEIHCPNCKQEVNHLEVREIDHYTKQHIHSLICQIRREQGVHHR